MRKSVFTELLHHFQPFTADLIDVCVYCTLYTVQVLVYCTLTYILTFALMYAECSMQGYREGFIACRHFRNCDHQLLVLLVKKSVNYQLYSVCTSSTDQSTCTRHKGPVLPDPAFFSALVCQSDSITKTAVRAPILSSM